MTIIQRSALSLGNQLGRGGQGTVYLVTNRTINQQWDAVYKEYSQNVLADLRDGALAEMAGLISRLPGPDARWLCGKAAWPAGTVEAGGRVTGFLMRAVPGPFQFDMRNIGPGGGTSRRLAGLEFLLNTDDFTRQAGLPVSQRERLLLLADIAETVSRLHAMSIIVGDLSPKNVLFSMSPRPACFFIDCDAMRLRGADALPQMETPGWQVPAGEEPATAASDAYKFALLATRVIARDQDARDPGVLAGVSPALGDMARRGLGQYPGQRPAPADWVRELREAAQKATAAPPPPGPGTAPRVTAAPASVRAAWNRQTRSTRAAWNRQRRSTRAAIAAASAVAAVLLLILGVAVSQGTALVSPAGNNPPVSVPDSAAPLAPAPADTGDGSQPGAGFPTQSSEPSYSPSPAPSPSPADALAGAGAGDCYWNNRIMSADWHEDSSCQNGDYKVVQVISGTTDQHRCDNVSGSDWEVPDLVGDQVLCMMFQDSNPAFAARTNQCVFGPPGSDATWDMASCSPGNFTVTGFYQGTTDSSKCSGSDSSVWFTVPGNSDIDEVMCLTMNYPLVVTAPQHACLWESGSGSDASFSNVSSCADANVEVEGRVQQTYDSSFCGQYGWYTWFPRQYQDLGWTVCLGTPG